MGAHIWYPAWSPAPSYKGKVRVTDFDERTIVQWGNPIAFDCMDTPSHSKQLVFGECWGRGTLPASEASCQKLGHSGSTKSDTLQLHFTNYVLTRNSIRILETVMCTEWFITLITILNNFSPFILENKVSLPFMLHKSHQSWVFSFFFFSMTITEIYVQMHIASGINGFK